MSDRNKRLTEAIGRLCRCGDSGCDGDIIDFSTGNGAMILWDWATTSHERWNKPGDKYGDFWADFCRANGGGFVGGFMTVPRHLIHPDRFADKLDEFLHGGKDE